jgi:hypothetical protein
MIPRTSSTSSIVRKRSAEVGAASVLTLATTGDDACVFYDADHGRLCSIQRDAGAELMPSACHNFPRVTLRDARGVFITLSHFCPTAARLLLAAADISRIPAPAAISLGGDAEGLDATNVMPPLLRPDMLTDLDGYNAWEREGLAVLNDRDYSARLALAIIAAATADMCDWRPGVETLEMRVTRAFQRARSVPKASQHGPHSAFEHPTKAFLAAHLFASWTAYQSSGLPAVVQSLESALALLGNHIVDEQSFIDAVRAADLRLRHSGDHCPSHVSPGSLPALRRR